VGNREKRKERRARERAERKALAKAAAGNPCPAWTPFREVPAPEGYTLQPGERIFVNSRYQVFATPVPSMVEHGGWPAMVHLSIKRHDREPIHDWRDLQRVKNEIVGPNHEAVELYPAESRVVDTSNQFHIWVLQRDDQSFPFGFMERRVAENSDSGGGGFKAKQRPFEEGARPDDCRDVTPEEMDRQLKALGHDAETLTREITR